MISKTIYRDRVDTEFSKSLHELAMICDDSVQEYCKGYDFITVDYHQDSLARGRRMMQSNHKEAHCIDRLDGTVDLLSQGLSGIYLSPFTELVRPFDRVIDECVGFGYARLTYSKINPSVFILDGQVNQTIEWLSQYYRSPDAWSDQLEGDWYPPLVIDKMTEMVHNDNYGYYSTQNRRKVSDDDSVEHPDESVSIYHESYFTPLYGQTNRLYATTYAIDWLQVLSNTGELIKPLTDHQLRSLSSVGSQVAMRLLSSR